MTQAKLPPHKVLLQELSLFAAHYELRIDVRELKAWSLHIYKKLNDELLSHKEAAHMLGVSMDMLHIYRQTKRIEGMPKNSSARRIHYVYRLTDVLELKQNRVAIVAQREGTRD